MTKPESEFYKGQGNTCKKCNNERTRQWKRDNPLRWRAARKSREKTNKNRAISRRKSRLKRRYKLTLERAESILESQNRRCAICGVELLSPAIHPEDAVDMEGEWAVFDHNHDTGFVRGALCSQCNVGLGNFNDDIALIYKAYYYLRDAHRRMKAQL